MTVDELEKIVFTMGGIVADEYLDKDIRHHYKDIVTNINILNEAISQSTEQTGDYYNYLVQIVHQYYLLKDAVISAL